MAEEIQYEQLDAADAAATSADAVDLARISDIPMELSVEIGRTEMTVGETLALGVGMIVALDRLAGEPVHLLANGTPIARGEVIVIDDRLGLRIGEIIENASDGQAAASEPPAGGDQLAEGLSQGTPEPLTPQSPAAEAHSPAAEGQTGEPIAA